MELRIRENEMVIVMEVPIITMSICVLFRLERYLEDILNTKFLSSKRE